MLHLQTTAPNWTECLPILPAGSLVKAVDNGQLFREAKGINPGLVTCLRHHYDSGQIFGGTWEDNLTRARAFFASFVDGTFRTDIAPWCDYIEGWNEYLANSQNAQEIGARILWARAAAQVWKYEYRVQAEYAHIRLVLCNTAIGNDIPKPFFEICRDYAAVMGYHPYTLWKNKQRDPGDWQYYSGRWVSMEQNAGIKVDWLFTECGPFESAATGWRSPECLNFDRTLYVESVRQWLRDVQQTAAYKEGRTKGFALFTTGRAGDVWNGYWTEQPELNQLAIMVAMEWKPGNAPPPPPPPPPANDFEQAIWADSLIKQTASFNPDAALQKVIFAHDFVPVMNEDRFTYNGVTYAEQAAENLSSGERRVYYCVVGDWGNVRYVQNVQNTPFEFEVWPTDYKTATQPFGARPDYYRQFYGDDRGHQGIDIAAPLGAYIMAVAPGKVIKVSDKKADGQPSNYGWHIVIQHPGGWQTLYAHLEPAPLVTVGDAVEADEEIGFSGNTGNSTGPHLHLQLRGPDGDIVDPTPYLEAIG